MYLRFTFISLVYFANVTSIIAMFKKDNLITQFIYLITTIIVLAVLTRGITK